MVENAFNVGISDWIYNFLKLLWKEDRCDSLHSHCFIASLKGLWVHRNAIVFKKASPYHS